MSERLSSFANEAINQWRLSDNVQKPTGIYIAFRQSLHVLVPALWKARVFNRHVEPTEGGAVYICNHQSFLDPILMSYGLRRPMNYMARDSLFRNAAFGGMIRSVHAFPVKRNAADTGALKEAMRRIKSGGQIAVFPEGTRTEDGRIGKFLPGVAFLAQRANATTIPVLIDGAFECWPRNQLLPSPGQIVVQYGRPISAEEARSTDAQGFVNRVRNELIEIQREVRRRVGRPELKYE